MDFFVLFWGVYSLTIYLLLCGAAGEFAKSRGHSMWFGFFIALFFSPLVGFAQTIGAGNNLKNIEANMIKKGEAKRCPSCAEIIKKEAIICRYCSSDLGLA